MATNYLQILASLSPFIVVGYLGWKEWKSGDSALAKKIKDDYRERSQQLERRVTELEAEHKEHSVQIAKLEATVQEKDNQIKRYEAIFANRNPDLTTVLNEISDFMKSISSQNMHQTSILEKIKK